MLRSGKDKGRRFDHYDTMKTKEICRLPVEKISEDDSVLFLWTTNTFLKDAFKVMDVWGFKYHVTITWDKGAGITMRGFHRVTEFLLFGYKGRFPDIFRGVPIKTLITQGRLKHSEKPNIFRKIIVDKFGDVPRIELFARQRVEGWAAWGNEV